MGQHYSEIVSENYRWHESGREFEDMRDGRRYPDSSYSAKVNVYDDRVRNWFLDLAVRQTAAGSDPGDYVALSIALAYLEGVEQYRRGEGKQTGSTERFKSSARRVFPAALPDAIDRLWTAVRNGLFHSGFTEGPTLLSHDYDEALTIFGRYLRINPAKFVKAVVQDFNNYIQELRAGPSSDLARRFVQLWDERWDQT